MLHFVSINLYPWRKIACGHGLSERIEGVISECERILGVCKRSGKRAYTAMAAEQIRIEGDGAAVGILEALFGFEGFAECIGRDDINAEILQEIIDIGRKDRSAVHGLKPDINMIVGIGEICFVVFADICSVKICVTTYPYGKMTEMRGRKLAHIGFSTEVEGLDPFFVRRKDIEAGGADMLVIAVLRSLGIVRYGIMLYEDIVVNTVITVKYRHKAGYLGPVTDVVRSIAGLTLPVDYAVNTGIDEAEATEHEVMDTCNTFTGYND